VRQGEGPDDHRQRHQPERAFQRRGRCPEDGREPVQQVREEQQQRDVEPLQEVLQEPARMLRNDLRLAEHHDEPERPEAERRPRRRAIALPMPLIDRDQRQHDVRHKADVAQNLDR
jgi:hypothetical protein